MEARRHGPHQGVGARKQWPRVNGGAGAVASPDTRDGDTVMENETHAPRIVIIEKN
jgi:hypothetical protein